MYAMEDLPNSSRSWTNDRASCVFCSHHALGVMLRYGCMRKEYGIIFVESSRYAVSSAARAQASENFNNQLRRLLLRLQEL